MHLNKDINDKTISPRLKTLIPLVRERLQASWLSLLNVEAKLTDTQT